ncbi:MAG TPA: glycoside hydrolase family 35 protein [Candidatus Acidoferrum sp.]|nr:glycoside hydrolase family 35 protein [Candidatus Acidoferrum sp.]
MKTAVPHSIRIERGQFVLDGQPFQIISGEMHYARIPRAYWRDRLRKARAMGLNTISTYVFWNLHEPKPGIYDFHGQLDVAEFVREAQQERLYVIVRAGPYICSEWDLGGLPAWLLADPHMKLRSRDESFLRPAAEWMRRLGRELAPLQITRGGPIIAVQVENEYGSFGTDHVYMSRIRDMIRAAGFRDVILYTADGAIQLPDGTLPDLPAVVNFGPGEARSSFAALKTFRPQGPFMNGEYWDGWFDHWGAPHHVTDAKQQAEELDWMLSQGYSVNLYMFEGGTSFGFMAGANYERAYEPDTTSYDYDAPLDEAGRLTKKYFAFRDVIVRNLHDPKLPPVPAPVPIIAIPKLTLTESASLWTNLGRGLASERPKTMASLGQSYGYILYRTRLKGPAKGDLVTDKVHDYAEIFVNQQLAGTLDRRLDQSDLHVEFPERGNTLDILVENTGRINFGPKLRDDRKGITHSVTFAGRELTGWQIFSLPMPDPTSFHFTSRAVNGPAFYRGFFDLDAGGDTFLDTRGMGKGAVWVNGKNLGRFWNIGPQQTLYLPGAWLRRGRNEVVVFEMDSNQAPSIQGLRQPILNEVHTNSTN